MQALLLLGALVALVGAALLAAGQTRLGSGADGTAYALGTAPASKRAVDLNAGRPASWRATRTVGALLLAGGLAAAWLGWSGA